MTGGWALNVQPAWSERDDGTFAHWRAGLDSSQRIQPAEGDWYFNHMGMRDNADTIRVCRAAAAQR